MPEGLLLDNDVVLKACAYRCHVELVATTTINGVRPSILGLARFTLRTRLSRQGCDLRDPQGATAALEHALEKVDRLEPTEDEIALAADLEERATAIALGLDTGESQLVAILLSRSHPLLITGDKRAMKALASIAAAGTEGRIACLEQLFAALLSKHPIEPLRAGVCGEPGADKAATACFACAAPAVDSEDVLAGLASYIHDLRKATGRILVDDARLLAIVS